MSNDFTIEVIASGDRNRSIELCRECLMASHGDIIDFKMFSDLLLNFRIEIMRERINELISELEKYGFNVSCKMNDLSSNVKALSGNLSVTFASGKGERKDIIPSVPG